MSPLLRADGLDRGCWAVAALFLGLFWGSMLYHTGGQLSLPLDDSFIYFQYARQLAAGQFLHYNPEDPPTTGAASLLYVLLLVPGCWLGFQGLLLSVYAAGLGLVFLGASLWLMRRLGMALGDWDSGIAAMGLTLLCGPLLWGFFSGMEIGLFTCAILLTLYLFVREAPGGDFRRTAGAAALLVLARPEGAALAACLIGVWAGRAWRQRQPRQAWVWLAPILAFALQGLLYEGLTGSFTAAGTVAKWRFCASHASWPEVIRLALADSAAFCKGVLGGSLGPQTSARLFAYDSNTRHLFFGPFFSLFYLAGMAPRLADEWRARAPGTGALAFLWLAGGVLLTCTLVEPDAHFNRYQQPFLPLFILFAALGLGQAGQLLGGRLRLGLSLFYGLWGLLSVGFFAVAYGRNSADIRHLQMAMAQILADSLPAHSSVALNDAGALKYLSGHYTVDLVGLTSPGLARAWRHGSGSLYEQLEAMEPGRRPEYFAIFPNWFNFEEAGFLRPLRRVRVFAPSIVDAEKVLYQADWRLANSGDALHSPRLLQQARDFQVVDHIDVAAIPSEDQHGYRSGVWEKGQEEANLLIYGVCEEDSSIEVIDGGRTITRNERMQVRLRPGARALMAMRTVTGVHQRFAVYCQGQPVGQVETPGGPGRNWTEFLVAEIPASRVGQGQVEIETRAAEGSVIVSFYYWFLQ